MPTTISFQEAAKRALAANRSMGNRKNTASAKRARPASAPSLPRAASAASLPRARPRAASAPSLPSSSGTNAVERRLIAIECSIKRIELQLKLVDGEIMGNEEFEKLKTGITKCTNLGFNNFKEHMNFLRSVDNKRADNRFKYILNVISIVCPLLSACNIGFLKNINTEEISSELIGDAIKKTTGYLATLSGAINNFIENGSEIAGNIDTLMDLNFTTNDAFDTYKEGAEKSVEKISKMAGNVITLQRELCNYLVINLKSLTNKFRSSTKLNWNILSKTFCICVFYYILFSSVAGNDGGTSGNATNATNATRITMIEGGKKKKKRK